MEDEEVGQRRASRRLSTSSQLSGLGQGRPRRRSSRIADSKTQPLRSQAGLLSELGIGLSKTLAEESEEPISLRNPGHAMRVLYLRLKKRLRKLGRQCRQALRKEWRSCCGQSNTTKALSFLYRNHPDQVRQSLWENLQTMYDTMLGRKQTAATSAASLTGAPLAEGLKKARRAAVRLVGGKKTDGSKPGFGIHCFIINNPGIIDDFYHLDEQIGAGGSAKVYKAHELGTKVLRAVKKIYKRSSADLARYVFEMAIMKTMDHPNIIRLYETFEDDDAIYLVLEYCQGGDVLDRLITQGLMTENDAGVVVRGTLNVLNYLDANGYVHRDIKPENIMFKENMADATVSHIRVVDFGYSCKAPDQDSGAFMHTKVGTPYYVAPEVLSGEYGKECDMWSVGVLTYMLLAGYPPFFGETDADTIRSVAQGQFTFHASQWGELSKSCKHFVRKLLEVDVSKRMKVAEALEHRWLIRKARGRVDTLREETVERLVTFSRYHSLKRSALLALAYQMDSEDVKPLMELFRGLDLNGDGLLTREEFIKAVKACGVEGDLIKDMIRSVDADNSGIIDYTEFLAATLERFMFIDNHGVVLRAFRSFDQDDSGELTANEIAETIDMAGSEHLEQLEQIFVEVDKNQDGVMDYGEFFEMLCAQASAADVVALSAEDNEADRQQESSALDPAKDGSSKEPPGSPKGKSSKVAAAEMDRSSSKGVKFGGGGEQEDNDEDFGKSAERPKSARFAKSDAADETTPASARGSRSARKRSSAAEPSEGSNSARGGAQQAAEDSESAEAKSDASFASGSADHLAVAVSQGEEDEEVDERRSRRKTTVRAMADIDSDAGSEE